MKVLHTADLHLKSFGDERWQALQALLELGAREKVDVLAVCGDLFDRGVDLLKLQDPLRAALSGLSFTVLILPGNHDCAAFGGGIFLGDSAIVLDDWQRPYTCGEAVFWGLPFEPIGGVEIVNRLRALAARMAGGRRHLLLYHGELLDAFFSRPELGEEGTDRYMPVKLSYFEHLPVDCVLAGHFHSGFRAWTIKRNCFFAYPGSPVSVTRRETGRRAVNLFEISSAPREHLLETFHFDSRTVTLDPFGGLDPLSQVEQALKGLHPAAGLLLTVGGYIDGSRGLDESALAGRLRALIAGRLAGEPLYTFRDIRAVLQDELFTNFLDKLNRSGGGAEDVRRRRELALRAMMEARLCS